MDKWLINTLVLVVSLVWVIVVGVSYINEKYAPPSTVHFCMMTILGASLGKKMLDRGDEGTKDPDLKVDIKKVVKRKKRRPQIRLSKRRSVRKGKRPRGS